MCVEDCVPRCVGYVYVCVHGGRCVWGRHVQGAVPVGTTPPPRIRARKRGLMNVSLQKDHVNLLVDKARNLWLVK